MCLEKREHVRGRDLASPRDNGKGNPALGSQIGQPCDPATRAGMIRCTHDLKRLRKEPLVIEVVGPVAVVTKPDRGLTPPDQTADFGAGRGTQGQIDIGMFTGKAFHDGHQPAAGKSALHLVSAWAGQNHLVLGQRAVDGKSDEITAIPELLALLDLTGAVVTLDAMGCQKEIVSAIRDRGADYVITVKGNQGTLYDDLSDYFIDCLDNDFAAVPYRYQRRVERGHGRHEARHYYVTEVPKALRTRDQWRGLRSVGMVYAERQVGTGEVGGETRFFISSLRPEVKAFARAVR